MFSILFLKKKYRLWDNVGKCVRSRQATDGNVAHARCMLDISDCRRTLRIWNTYCCSDGCMNASQGYVYSTLLLLFTVKWVSPPSFRERQKNVHQTFMIGIRFMFWLYRIPNIIPGPVRYYKFSSWRRRPFFRSRFPPSAWHTLVQISLEVPNFIISADRVFWGGTITRHGVVVILK
jgi:hypothetical protein